MKTSTKNRRMKEATRRLTARGWHYAKLVRSAVAEISAGCSLERKIACQLEISLNSCWLHVIVLKLRSLGVKNRLSG